MARARIGLEIAILGCNPGRVEALQRCYMRRLKEDGRMACYEDLLAMRNINGSWMIRGQSYLHKRHSHQQLEISQV